MKTKDRRVSKNLHDIRSPKEAAKQSTKMSLELITRRRLADPDYYDKVTDEYNSRTARRLRHSYPTKIARPEPTVPAHASKFSGSAKESPKKTPPKKDRLPSVAPIPKSRVTDTQVTPGKWEEQRKKSGKAFRDFFKKDRRG